MSHVNVANKYLKRLEDRQIEAERRATMESNDENLHHNTQMLVGATHNLYDSLQMLAQLVADGHTEYAVQLLTLTATLKEQADAYN